MDNGSGSSGSMGGVAAAVVVDAVLMGSAYRTGLCAVMKIRCLDQAQASKVTKFVGVDW